MKFLQNNHEQYKNDSFGERLKIKSVGYVIEEKLIETFRIICDERILYEVTSDETVQHKQNYGKNIVLDFATASKYYITHFLIFTQRESS